MDGESFHIEPWGCGCGHSACYSAVGLGLAVPIRDVCENPERRAVHFLDWQPHVELLVPC